MRSQYPDLTSRGFRDMSQNQKRKTKERVEILLLKGLNSGIPTPLTEQDWDDIRQLVRLKIQGYK